MNTKKLKRKIIFKIALVNILFEILVNTPIIIASFIFKKEIQCLIFYFVFGIFRVTTPHIYHCKARTPLRSLLYCLCYSSAVFVFALKNIAPLGVSIFSSVIIGMIVVEIANKIQGYNALMREKLKQSSGIYSMSEQELRDYAKLKGVGEMMTETLILRVIYNYKWCEIREKENYTRHAIDYHKRILEHKLNIKL